MNDHWPRSAPSRRCSSPPNNPQGTCRQCCRSACSSTWITHGSRNAIALRAATPTQRRRCTIECNNNKNNRTRRCWLPCHPRFRAALLVAMSRHHLSGAQGAWRTEPSHGNQQPWSDEEHADCNRHHPALGRTLNARSSRPRRSMRAWAGAGSLHGRCISSHR